MDWRLGDRVSHLKRPEWGSGEVVQILEQDKIVVSFDLGGRRTLKNAPLSMIARTDSKSDPSNIKPAGNAARRPRETQTGATRKSAKPRVRSRPGFASTPICVPVLSRQGREPEIDAEFELALRVLARITSDIGPTAEPNTALLLYTLLQTPGIAAHALLGELDAALRARLFIESWRSAQDRHFGVSLEHIRYAARRVAIEVCGDARIDSRHLLLMCLAGSGFLSNPAELGLTSKGTSPEHIIGRSNLAVRAMEDVGVDSAAFFQNIRRTSKSAIIKGPPSFFVMFPQRDRTRVFRVEEVGEFFHNPAGSMIYPATVGLMDRSLGKPLDALLEFEDLLNLPGAPESVFQRFFERNPEFLLADDYLACQPGVLLETSEGYGLKPDFFLQRRDSPLWDIAELKLPDSDLIQGRIARRGLAAAVRWGLDQLRRYREYFLDAGLAKQFRERHGLEVYFPRLTLIIGRDTAFGDYHERQRLTPPEARLLTYDDLLRFAKHRSLILPLLRDDKA